MSGPVVGGKLTEAAPREPPIRVVHVARYVVPPWVEGVTNTVQSIASFEGAGVTSRIITIIHRDDKGDYPDRVCIRSSLDRASERGLLFDVQARLEDARLANQIVSRIATMNEQQTIDIIHVHNFSHTALRMALRRFLREHPRTKLVASHYGESGSRFKWLQRRGARLAVRGFDLHVCTSARSASRLERIGVPPSQIRVVPPPAQLETFQGHQRRPQRSVTRIGYIGNVSDARFPIETLDALVRGLGPANAELTVVMSTRSVNDEWVTRATSRLFDEKRFRIERRNLDPQQKAEFLANTDVFVLPFQQPSAIDPPVTLVEAMASGCICVVTPVQASPDLAANGKTAIVVEAAPDVFADEALRVARDPTPYWPLAVAAQAQVMTRFSIENVGNELRSAYEGALGGTFAGK